MRYWFAIGTNFDEDHITRAKHHARECLDINVMTNHDDRCSWKLLKAFLNNILSSFAGNSWSGLSAFDASFPKEAGNGIIVNS